MCDPNIQSLVADQTPAQLCIGETLTLDNNPKRNKLQLGLWGAGDDHRRERRVRTHVHVAHGWRLHRDLGREPGWPCADTSEAIYMVYPPVEPQIVLEGFSCETETRSSTSAVEGNNIDEFADIQWDFGVGSPTLSNLESPSNINYGDASSWRQPCTSRTTVARRKRRSITTRLQDPVAVVEDQYQFCTGSRLTLSTSQKTQSLHLGFWRGQGGLPAGTSTDPNPTYTFPDTGVYTITLSAGADFSCPDYATAEVEIQFLLEPEFVAPTPDCFEDHYFSMEGVASVDENTVYEWDFGGSGSSQTSTARWSTGIYAEPGTYEVSLTASVPGLTDAGDVQRSGHRHRRAHHQFEAGPTSGCPRIRSASPT